MNRSPALSDFAHGPLYFWLRPDIHSHGQYGKAFGLKLVGRRVEVVSIA
jgi:hypothetical protein